MSNTLNVVDAIMGAGKTTAMIRYINESNPDRRYIFCTPLLKEVERLKESCHGHNFVSPESYFAPKTEDVKALIKANLDIATTHALFMRFDDEIKDLIRERDYTLIIDESIDVISEYDISPADAKTITEKYCQTMDDGQLIWTAPDYSGRFDDYRFDVESGVVYQYSPRNLIKMYRIDSFEVFSEVFLMTYLFNGHPTKAYFDLNGWEYRNWYVAGNAPESYRLTESPVVRLPADYRNLITVVHTFRGSQLKTHGSAFSLSWYNQNCPNSTDFQQLKKHMATFFKKYGSDGPERNMWTTFEKHRKDLSGARYAKGFLFCSAKATNDYRNKNVLAYPINRYPNPNLSNFLLKHGGRLDKDGFALVEMIQWVWRSAVRDKQPITLYIPSDRMYQLFMDWLESLEAMK